MLIGIEFLFSFLVVIPQRSGGIRCLGAYTPSGTSLYSYFLSGVGPYVCHSRRESASCSNRQNNIWWRTALDGGVTLCCNGSFCWAWFSSLVLFVFRLKPRLHPLQML